MTAASSRSASWPICSASSTSCWRTAAASFSSSSGSRPALASSGSSADRCRCRSAARMAVPRSRSSSADSRYQVSCARVSRGPCSAAAASSCASRACAAASCCSTSVRRARSWVSSRTSESSAARSTIRSSASSRSRASRRSAWTSPARRATSAWRPSGLSWRRSSAVRSCSRVRLACIASSLRRAFSLRFLCLRTPAASSMNARRSSGRADRTASSWPCPTTTCSSRPMPLSLISSCTSISRHFVPLMEYSLAPSRNISRVMLTSV